MFLIVTFLHRRKSVNFSTPLTEIWWKRFSNVSTSASIKELFFNRMSKRPNLSERCNYLFFMQTQILKVSLFRDYIVFITAWEYLNQISVENYDWLNKLITKTIKQSRHHVITQMRFAFSQLMEPHRHLTSFHPLTLSYFLCDKMYSFSASSTITHTRKMFS